MRWHCLMTCVRKLAASSLLVNRQGEDRQSLPLCAFDSIFISARISILAYSDGAKRVVRQRFQVCGAVARIPLTPPLARAKFLPRFPFGPANFPG
jgi:hypothetical protein